MSESLRYRLIEKLTRVPDDALEALERVLDGVLSPAPRRDWHHAPAHRFSETGTYIVTAATYQHAHLFRGDDALDRLQERLLEVRQDGWEPEAWAVFSNHYHFVAHADPGAAPLTEVIRGLHRDSALWLNRRDGLPGRVVWHNYWDTHLTFEASYLARLHYVLQNPVKHGLVPRASLYRWCSADAFERSAPSAHVRKVLSMKIDRVKVEDDFQPV